MRVSVRLLLRSWVRASVVEPSGGKSHRGGGDVAFDIGLHGGLVALDGEEVVGPVFEDQRPGGVGLRVEV